MSRKRCNHMSQVGFFIAGSRNRLQPGTTKQRVFWKGVRELPGGRKGGSSAPRRPGTRRQPLLEAPTGERGHPSALPLPPAHFSHSPNSNSQENKLQSSHPVTTGTSLVTPVGDSQGRSGAVRECARRASVYAGRDRCLQEPEQRLPLLGTPGPHRSEGGAEPSHALGKSHQAARYESVRPAASDILTP